MHFGLEGMQRQSLGNVIVQCRSFWLVVGDMMSRQSLEKRL
jgi:hypothetical protein